ncbi:MAG: acetate--CoA ligase family protein, partial [Alphaproteobacteria bacterium]|nr:acetate--CoA ligase family protein [Alphaproteobacteria bacterium]
GLGEAILVERMVEGAVAELIIGVGRDPVVGLHLLIGAGGVFAELLDDSRILVMHATREEIIDALGALKAAALLKGHRGRPRGDIEAAVSAILGVQSFAIENADRLLELDVNPLMIRPEGRGAVAADAYIRLIEGAEDAGG